jgi:hypothetical protein
VWGDRSSVAYLLRKIDGAWKFVVIAPAKLTALAGKNPDTWESSSLSVGETRRSRLDVESVGEGSIRFERCQ